MTVHTFIQGVGSKVMYVLKVLPGKSNMFFYDAVYCYELSTHLRTLLFKSLRVKYFSQEINTFI